MHKDIKSNHLRALEGKLESGGGGTCLAMHVRDKVNEAQLSTRNTVADPRHGCQYDTQICTNNNKGIKLSISTFGLPTLNLTMHLVLN